MKTIRLEQPKKLDLPKFDLAGVNAEFKQLTVSLGLLGLPKFDADLSDYSRFDVKTIVRATITHRATNKWQQPDKSNQSLRRRKTVLGWYDNESRLKNLDLAGVRKTLACNRIGYEIGYKVLRRLKNPKSLNIQFGPGESFNSAKGDTSLLAKLEPIHHSVSFDNLDLWVSIIVSFRGLFLPYLEFWWKNIRTKVKGSLEEFTRVKNQKDWKRAIVHEVIDSIPNYVVLGSRQAFVDKDNEEDRVIEVNPAGDVVCQKVVGSAFREVLLEYGIDLDINQTLHKGLISDKTLATIDASKASDTITLHHIKWLFPLELSIMLQRLSQKWILATTEYGAKEWTLQNKLCSMGSGFTFELLTTIFYCIGRRHTRIVYAYGDDLIVPRAVASMVVADLESAGFIINRKKTFLSGPLSESCGGYHLEDYGYITCYSLKWCNNPVEAVAAINKLGRILRDYQAKIGTDEFSCLLEKTWRNLLSKTQSLYAGPVISLEKDIPTWIENPNYKKRKKDSAILRDVFHLNLDTIEAYAWSFQRSIIEFDIVYEFKLVNEVRCPTKTKVSYKPLLYAYIKSGMRTKFEIKNHGPDQRVVVKPVLVDSEGYFI